MNVDAVVVTSNVRDFSSAKKSLGLSVMNPTEFLTQLAAHTEED